jgi:hypothetical protein
VSASIPFPSLSPLPQGKTGPKTKLSDVVTVREPKEELPDVPVPEVNLAAFPPAPAPIPTYGM